MKSSYHLDILRGRSEDLPDVRSKIVRVFLSSTFTDTLSERDSLIENIFPKLKDYCREKYGLEFQYADMRWGIQTESANNHGEVETCMKEITLCKKYSVATNFVVLLSHRYGSRPIPADIRASLFELLRTTVLADEHSQSDGELLAQWYQLDTNRVPATYVLRSISSILPNFLSSNTEEMKEADKEWKRINNRIRNCLRQAAATCLERGQITENDYDEFFTSVTEKEIRDGILLAPDANERSLCFLREIVDIHDHLSDNKASKYIDMLSSEKNEQPSVDHEAEQLLDRLKHKRIPAVLKSQNIFKYKVHWSAKGINRQDHVEYIEQFNQDFYTAVQQQIDRCVQSRFVITSDSLQHEVLQHAIQCKTYVAKFHGRTDVLQKLEQFMKNDRERRPCIVYGESGCGKTSILAKAATEVFKWWSGRSVSVVLRFLGTTPASSTMYKVLLSISEQISELYNLPMTTYSSVVQLRDQLETNLLLQIPDDEYLLLLLDSIDQLQPDAYDCKWLPSQFPSNVKCIVSTLPEHGNIFQNLRNLIGCPQPTPDDPVVQVPPFEALTVELVYNDWLRVKQRALSDEQRQFIRNLMQEKKEILPLFMKLVFDIFSVWHSYDPLDEHLKELRDVDDCIRYLFSRLQVIHNRVLFGRALCYMSACRSGISQNELEDVLSLDDDVLKSVFQHYIPPVRRLPGILWTRIRNDLDEYITEKEIDDSPVIYWYHRRFIEVAQEQYIQNLGDADRKLVFQNMIDLYKETWKGKNKPFKIDDPKLVNKYQLTESAGEIQANRFTTSQPIEFLDADGRIQYNKRKLNELPQFLRKLTADIGIPIAAEEIFFNYSFMRAKFACSSFVDIQEDMKMFERSISYKTSNETQEVNKEIELLSKTYLMFGLLLNEYPDNYAFELSSRMLTFFGVKPNITSLLKQCDQLSPRHCALIVPYYQLQAPGSGLLYSMYKHTMPVVDLDFTDDQMAAISLSNKIIVINMETGDTVVDLKLPKLDEPYLNSTTLPKMISRDVGLDSHSDKDSGESDSSHADRFEQFLFLVNSHHHIYLISVHRDIKFQRSSTVGYLTVEVFDRKRGLCILAEENSHCVECWDVGQDRMHARIDLPSDLTIKNIFCLKQYSMVIVILHNSNIQVYVLEDAEFARRATINGGRHLNLVAISDKYLVCTFDSTIPIDFALIPLSPFYQIERTVANNEILKTLVAFDPPIGPIERIVSPQGLGKSDKDSSKAPMFMAITSESVCVVHHCQQDYISYVRIPGKYDLVEMFDTNPHLVYTSRGGIIELHKWQCVEGEDDREGKCQNFHKYQLYVTIDISSSPVTNIRPSSDAATLFLCSMQNGAISAYLGYAARSALKKLPNFPRTNQLIGSIALAGEKAVTIDISKHELTTWSYQHSTSIESTRLFRDSTIIDDYVVSDAFVLVLTNTQWAEIYAVKSLHKEPLFRLHLRAPARAHSTSDNSFLLVTNVGLMRRISEQTSGGKAKFGQTGSVQLKIDCARMLSSVLTLNSIEHLVVLADDGHSLAVWTTNQVIYIDVPNLPSSHLLRITGERNQELLLLSFEDRSLLSCRVQLSPQSDSGSLQMTPFDTADMFCLKNNCLATTINGENQLNLHNISLCVCHEPIQLDNECEQLCLNESGSYVFALVKPRVLCMYRVSDRRQLAKLFVYDFVSTMVADNDFIVLGMNDRRLLTLMIADPDDPKLQSKIDMLPSRSPPRASHSAAKRLVKELENQMDMDSSDYDSNVTSDANSDQDTSHNSNIQKTVQPVSLFRIVSRLNGRYSRSKMSNDAERRAQVIDICGGKALPTNVADFADDSDNEEDNPFPIQLEQPVEPLNLDDLRQKASDYEQQQLKGIQLANAGRSNLRILNSYSTTSSTCMLL